TRGDGYGFRIVGSCEVHSEDRANQTHRAEDFRAGSVSDGPEVPLRAVAYASGSEVAYASDSEVLAANSFLNTHAANLVYWDSGRSIRSLRANGIGTAAGGRNGNSRAR